MKASFVLFLLLAVTAVGELQAQRFIRTNGIDRPLQVGLQAGYSTGQPGDFTDWVLGADLFYRFTELGGAIDLGGALSYQRYFNTPMTDDFANGNVPVDFSFVHVGIGARIALFRGLEIGGDGGYAFRVSEPLESTVFSTPEDGFWLRPIVAVSLSERVQIFTSFDFVDSGDGIGNVNVGVYYGLL